MSSTEELAQNLLGRAFITVFDFSAYRFTEHLFLEALTGYTPAEFTIEKLYSDIVHPEDKEAVMRYNQCAYRLITNQNFTFEALKDCYCCNFRIFHRKEHILSVRRSCYIYRLEPKTKKPTQQLDIWEILPDYSFDGVVRPTFISATKQNEIFSLFYEENLKLLKHIQFTPKQLQVLAAKSEGLYDKEIAEKLHISQKTVEKHVSDLLKKSTTFLQQKGISHARINDKDELIRFAKAYGLLPIPVRFLQGREIPTCA